MMDENFLLYRKRALELLDLMKAHGKSWSLYVFSSANAIRKYDVRQLVELGIEWIWLGLESSGSQYWPTSTGSSSSTSGTRRSPATGRRPCSTTVLSGKHNRV
jgi:hypothetical protein